MNWKKIEITNDLGEKVMAQAPVLFPQADQQIYLLFMLTGL